jgi:acyl-homoserine lactone acylase PvdQ
VYRVSTYLDIPHPLWQNEALGLNSQDEVLRQAFAEGYDLAVELAGDDPAAWRWSEVHQALFINSLMGHNLPVAEETLQEWDTRLNRQVPIGGSGFSPNAAHWLAGRGNFDVPGLMPSMRLIWDFADLDNSVMIISAGQSGNPDSPHYDDQMDIWQAGDYIPAPFSLEAVDANATTELILQPE